MNSCLVHGAKSQHAFQYRNFQDQISELSALAASLKISKEQFAQYVEFATKGYTQVTIDYKVVYETVVC